MRGFPRELLAVAPHAFQTPPPALWFLAASPTTLAPVSARQIPPHLCLLLPVLLLALLAWQLNFLCDDAYISFRYTRNLVEGLGLGYNPGSVPPVEGYSNFLWVLAMAPFEALGLDLGTSSRLLSAVSGLALCAWVTAHARQRFELDSLGTLLTGLFFASLPCSALWSTSGLATMPAALLLFGVYERLLGDPTRPRPVAAGIFGVFAVLMRADGFVWVGLLLFGAGLYWLWEQRAAELGRGLLVCASIVGAATLAHFAWRYSYYGDWLPNTARAKAGFSVHRLGRGFDYLMQWWLSVPAAALVMLLALRPMGRPWRAALCVSLCMALGAQAYALFVGGDFMPFGRFLVASMPFVTLLFAGHWKRWGMGPRAGALAFGMGAALVLSNALACFDINLVPESVRSKYHFRLSAPSWQSERTMRDNMAYRTADWTVLGKALARFTDENDSIVLAGIGAIGYFSRVKIHDVYGLISPEVIAATEPLERATPGHDRMVNMEFFKNQRPTLAGAYFAGINAPLSYNLPIGWEQSSLSQLVRIERHPLPADDVFAPGTELRLLVYKR